MKKALITGVTGQDGSFLSELLLSKGYEVHGVIRRTHSSSPEGLASLPPEIHNSRFFLHHADLNDTASIHSVIKRVLPSEIYNLAAQSHVQISFETPESTAEINALGPLRILESLRRLHLPCKYFQAASSEIFGRAGESPQRETTPFHPRNPYGAAKAFAFFITQNYREAYSMFTCNGILYDHESERRGDSFVSRKITKALGRIKYGLQRELWLGDLGARRDWGYAADYVEAMWRMLQEDEPGDYVIGTGQTHTVREFLALACSIAGLNPDTIVRTDPKLIRAPDMGILVADSTKIRKTLGWTPKVSFEQMVRLMVEHDMRLAEQEAASKSRFPAGLRVD